MRFSLSTVSARQICSLVQWGNISASLIQPPTLPAGGPDTGRLLHGPHVGAIALGVGLALD